MRGGPPLFVTAGGRLNSLSAKDASPASDAESRLHASRLKRLAVRAGRDLSIPVLSWEPHFKVVGLRRRESEIGRAERNDPIRQLQLAQDRFGMAGHLLERVVGAFGMRD